jgi:hypothetical protein
MPPLKESQAFAFHKHNQQVQPGTWGSVFKSRIG